MSQAGKLVNSVMPSGVQTLTGNAGGAVTFDGAGNIDVLGDGTLVSVTGTPASNLLTWTIDVDAITDYVTDAGTAEPSGGILNVLGGDVINTSGSGDTVTINVDNGLDGQVIIGSTAGSASYAFLTSTDGSIAFGLASNSIDMAVDIAAAGGIDGLLPDSGTNPIVPDVDGDIIVAGGTNINTVGSLNTLTVNLDNTVTISGTFTTTGGNVNIGTTTPGNPYDLSIERTVAGLIGSSIQNLSNNVAAGANMQIIVEPAAADAFILYNVNGAATWSAGIDNSDSDGWKLTTGSSPSGGSEVVTATTAGVVALPQYGTGIIASDASGVLSSITGTDGQVIIGATGSDPIFGSLASADGSIVFTPGANTLDLSVNAAAAGGIDGLIPDSGTSPVVPDVSGDVTVTGGTTGLTFVGSLNTLTLDGTLIVANGGTGATSLTDHGVLVGSGTSAVTALSVGTNGQVLLGSTGADPVFAALTSTDGSVTYTTGAGSLDLSVDTVSLLLTVTALDNTDSPYTVLSTDEVLSCDVSSGALTINLPNSTDTGRRIFIKDNSGNAATFNITLTTPGGTVTIDGSTSYVMNTDYQSVLVLFDGSNYIIL